MARILTITLNPALDLSVETAPLALGEVNRTGHTL
ncbi:MAG: 1-phosphofructokinase, partial [Mesoflavibacter sp.]|nr:1-phosphofructokinase [Mesoflavibacter sp.]